MIKAKRYAQYEGYFNECERYIVLLNHKEFSREEKNVLVIMESNIRKLRLGLMAIPKFRVPLSMKDTYEKLIKPNI